MSSTDKFDMRRALFLERLAKAWDKEPDMRMGHLLVEALGMQGPFDVLSLRTIEDSQLVEAIERYVLTGPPPSTDGSRRT
jgi:hypothetical protein